MTSLLRAWRARDLDLDFFASVGRPVDLDEGAAPLLVGARATAVDLVEDAVRSEPSRSVILVGDTGVGKTALLREALRRLAPQGWVGFEAAASDVMAGQMYIGMMEGRVQEIAQHMIGRPIAWLFPAFEEALWAGQHPQSPKGLLDALLPFVEARQVVVLAEIDPTAFALLAQMRPRVLRAFEVIRLPQMGEEEAIAVAVSYVESRALAVPRETLREALDLATHYLPGTAAPGNVLRLLELTLQRGERLGQVEVTPQTTTDTLSEATGLPLRVLDPRVPLDLEGVRAFFAGRVLGQPEAVDCLVDRIALVKAGLTDPTKPLGVFLFVGPTGTGKTEIAKALAEYLFGSAGRLVRLDMSEFQTPESLERLLSDSSMESNAAALVSSVRKQPFSVVLLDEFEKAHANVWDVFLQVFDDGRLTDRSGRTVDFRHCVVILTSNIGSAIPRTAALGFGSVAGGFDAAGVERAVARQFRPELLNRLDRVVVFRPLRRELMRELVELELTRTLGRRGFRAQPWAVEWDDAAIDFLVDRGFSAELGARPLKRAIEQHLLAPLAKTIVERRFPEGDQFLFITASASAGIRVRFVDPDADPAPAAAAPGGEWTLAALALDGGGAAGAAAFALGELERVERRLEPWRARKEEALAATLEPGFWDEADRATLGTIELLDRIEAAFGTARRLGARLERRAGGADVVRLVAERLYLLDAALDALEADEAPDALVRVRSSPSSVDPTAAAAFADEVRTMYRRWASLRGMRLHELDAGLGVAGLGAYRILRREAGLHVLELPGEHRTFARIAAHVLVSPWPVAATVEEVAASAAADAVEDTGEIRVVRRYRREPSPLVRDSRGWRTGRIDDVLGGAFDLLGDAGE